MARCEDCGKRLGAGFGGPAIGYRQRRQEVEAAHAATPAAVDLQALQIDYEARLVHSIDEALGSIDQTIATGSCRWRAFCSRLVTARRRRLRAGPLFALPS